MDSFCLHGHLVTEEQLLEDHYLIVEDGIIRQITPQEPPASIPRMETGDGCLVLPGFRDPHTHDVNGQLDVPNQSIDEIAYRIGMVTREFAKNGVTSFYLATFGAPLNELVKYCEGAKRWMESGENGVSGSKLLGMNIEGTFLNVECRGAQPAEYCLLPHRDDCIDAIDRLHATGAVRMMNIVPDYGAPSLDAIRHARSKGVMVGSGHLKPDAVSVRRAFEECGLQYMVHFTNGPTGQSFKPFGGGGAFEGGMDIPIVKELILDLVHIDRRYVLDMIRRSEERWGTDKVVAITDASFPLDSEVPDGEFRIGTTIALKDNDMNCLRAVAYLQPDGSRQPSPPNTLCGSILTMNQAFANLAGIFTQDIEGHWFAHRAMPLEHAVVKSARLCATTQAKLDGSYPKTGSITAGKSADLTIGKLSGATFNALQTLSAGNTLR